MADPFKIGDIFKIQNKDADTEAKSENKTQKQMSSGRNFNLIISIVLAVVLWLYVLGEVNPEVTVDLRNIPVQLLNEEALHAASLSVVQGQELSVNVRVKVKRSNKSKIAKDQITASVDLAELKHGENYVSVNIKAPDFVYLDQTLTPNITILIERVVEVTKQVNITYEGASQEGFEAEVVSFEPSKVRIRGSESAIAQVDKISGVLDISKITQDSSVNLHISPIDGMGNHVKGLTMDNDTISAQVELLQVKEVEFRVVMTPERLDGFSVTAEDYPDKIKIKGRQGTINNISVIQSKPVDVSQLAVTEQITLEPDMPNGVYLARSTKELTGNFVVEKTESKKLTYTADDITVNGLDEGFDYVIADIQIVAEVKGVASEISDVGQDRIKIYVDAIGLSEGEHSLELKYDAATVSNVTLEPKSITITITKTI